LEGELPINKNLLLFLSQINSNNSNFEQGTSASKKLKKLGKLLTTKFFKAQDLNPVSDFSNKTSMILADHTNELEAFSDIELENLVKSIMKTWVNNDGTHHAPAATVALRKELEKNFFPNLQAFINKVNIVAKENKKACAKAFDCGYSYNKKADKQFKNNNFDNNNDNKKHSNSSNHGENKKQKKLYHIFVMCVADYIPPKILAVFYLMNSVT
jgi:hypothetical protein